MSQQPSKEEQLDDVKSKLKSQYPPEYLIEIILEWSSQHPDFLNKLHDAILKHSPKS